MTLKIVLIHPPVVKPSEPPAGIARLSSGLQAADINHQLIDANLEGILHLMRTAGRTGPLSGRWDVRAGKNLEANLAALQNINIFSNRSRYSRAVTDVNRVLNRAGIPYRTNLSLSDFTDASFSPVKTTDLIQAANNPETNPFFPYFSYRLEQVLNEAPDFIGLSLNYLSQALCTMAMIGFIKRTHPRQKIILGGSLTTSWVKITGRTDLFPDLVDWVVAGPGEEKLAAILGVQEVPDDISTDYHLLAENRYLSPGLVLPYSAARGCWWRKCAFCPEKAEENVYQPVSVSRATEELQKLSCRTHPTLIHLLDSSIAPSLLTALAKRPPGAPWYGFARVTSQLADEDFCRALRAGGCVMLKLGIESGDQTVLDHLNKGIDLLTVSAALRTLHRAGIATYCYFLFGTPSETEPSALKTLDFVSRHSDCIDFLNLAIFNLPALSPEANGLATEDFYEGDLSLYKSFHHPNGWERPSVRNFLTKTFKKHPAVAPIIKRTPEFFTSNHAPFFVLKER